MINPNSMFKILLSNSYSFFKLKLFMKYRADLLTQICMPLFPITSNLFPTNVSTTFNIL